MRLSQSKGAHQGLKGILLSLTLWVGAEAAVSCEDARLKCAYRQGCGMALQNFLVSCSDLHKSHRHCPEKCQNALIALTSTDDGQRLMTCDCDEDEYCEEAKERVEVCRPHVLRATLNDTRVSCTVAQWICGADTLCSTALRYYNEHCWLMFRGKRCTSRCENSINILRRQEKAAKLSTCICNGNEDYDCHSIKKHMRALCFGKKAHHNGVKRPPRPPPNLPGDISNEVTYDPSSAHPAVKRPTTSLFGVLLCLYLSSRR